MSTIVIRHATVLTGTTAEPVVPDARIVSVDGEITEIGPDRGPVPDGATELDATGCTVVPGLHNLHDHVARKSLRISQRTTSYRSQSDVLMQQPAEFLALHTAANLAAQLASGVTTIRDFGLPGAGGIQAMRAVREGVIPGPRLYSGGDPICITGGHSSNWGAMEADGEDAVVRAVRTQIGRGAAVVKFMGSGGLGTYPEEEPGIPEFTEAELRAGITEAHKFHRPTATHAYSTEAIRNAVRAGSSTIEHGAFMDAAVVAEMVEHGTAFVPTLSSVAGIGWQHRLYGNEYLFGRIQNEIVGRHMESVALAWKAGVPVVTGTDTSGEVVEELELIAEATGADRLDVLASATRTAAQVARHSDLTGTIVPGLRADLLVAEGDLLTEGFEVLRRPRWVLRDGVVTPGRPLPLGVRLSQLRGLV
ncbi:amidohydrolase family protein [Kineosporia mesophila]|uniref:Amidohydrolase family protein n=1 Tax=Kineosporia mesophila TaxID=566012 RepID=A0ABP6Z4S8_9ACTN|nr:amidohydrolase family protein [Kineosporia mesophila]MCD5352549.1 amidohydrolase family protein [Kineosporia mesophila]